MSDQRFHAIIPAAGQGRRLGGETPKQYLEIGGQTVLEHVLQRVERTGLFQELIVVVEAGSREWARVQERLSLALRVVSGGAERCDSVWNGLLAIQDATPDDWVIVHDAARPCVHPSDILLLVKVLQNDAVGGLLGAPISDTIKCANPANEVIETLPRSGLWAAFTPQMFRYRVLFNALKSHRERKEAVATDEAQAVEAIGLTPRLVHGRRDNIKITRAEDLHLVKQFLRAE